MEENILLLLPEILETACCRNGSAFDISYQQEELLNQRIVGNIQEKRQVQ